MHEVRVPVSEVQPGEWVAGMRVLPAPRPQGRGGDGPPGGGVMDYTDDLDMWLWVLMAADEVDEARIVIADMLPKEVAA